LEELDIKIFIESQSHEDLINLARLPEMVVAVPIFPPDCEPFFSAIIHSFLEQGLNGPHISSNNANLSLRVLSLIVFHLSSKPSVWGNYFG
jgi:hypothetical protein